MVILIIIYSLETLPNLYLLDKGPISASTDKCLAFGKHNSLEKFNSSKTWQRLSLMFICVVAVAVFNISFCQINKI